MSEQNTAAVEYSRIIKDTYIEPVRSVIAVDDEFPTLDSYLERRAKGEQPEDKQPEGAGRLKNILDICRKRRWMFDVHDGRNIKVDDSGSVDIEHLHQTDLMLLDFQLEGDGDDGGKALDILGKIAANPHFNLVVVYSKKDPLDIFYEVRKRLLVPSNKINCQNADVAARWDDWKVSHKSEINAIRSKIDETTYFTVRRMMARRPDKDVFAILQDLPDVKVALEELNSIIQKDSTLGIKAEDVCMWILESVQDGLKAQMQEGSDAVVTWSEKPENDLNWIRTDRAFITIVQKEEDTERKLIDRLEAALCDWKPRPPRLILSNIRNLLESLGGTAEEEALHDNLTQAGWLYQVLGEEDSGSRQVYLEKMVKRQWHALHNHVEGQAVKFAECVVNNEKSTADNAAKSIQNHYDINISADSGRRDICEHLNAYECSQRIEGAHLITGHIIHMANKFWVCATPACDLNPSNTRGGDSWKNALGENIVPVKFLQLFQPNEGLQPTEGQREQALTKINRNLNLFLRIGEDYKIFQLTKDASTTTEPRWEQVLIADKARFSEGRKLTVLRSEKAEEAGDVKKAECGVFLKSYSAEVVAQLRYEYALHILHKLGASLSRVGLDFIKLENA